LLLPRRRRVAVPASVAALGMGAPATGVVALASAAVAGRSAIPYALALCLAAIVAAEGVRTD
jgi:hypothetical protein